jgi:hypothetical protein
MAHARLDSSAAPSRARRGVLRAAALAIVAGAAAGCAAYRAPDLAPNHPANPRAQAVPAAPVSASLRGSAAEVTAPAERPPAPDHGAHHVHHHHGGQR